MNLKQNPLIFLITRTWKFSKGNRKKLIASYLLSTIAYGFDFLNPLIIAWLMNVIQLEGVTEANIYKLIGIIALLVATTIGFWIFHAPSRIFEQQNAFYARATYRKYLLDGVLNLEHQWHVDHHSGDTIDKIEKGTNALYDFSAYMFDIFSIIFRFVGSFIALTVFHFPSTFIVIFMASLGILTIIQFDKRLRKHYKELFTMDNAISAKVYDTLSNVTTVIILRLERLLSKVIWKKIWKPYSLYKKNIRVNETKWFTVSFIASLMYLLVLGSYIYLNFRAGEAILVGTLFALYTYVDRINGSFFHVAWKFGDLVRQKAMIENAETLSNEFKEPLIDIEKLHHWQHLTIKGLTFTYYNKKEGELHLNNLTLTIKRGEKIAVIGESGSGKTTFLKLLRGLYTPRKATILLDETLISGGLKTISNDVTLIPQEPELFATTIKENITMGVPRNEQLIRHYTNLAKFTQVYERFPKKLNSSVVEKGVNMSGGEKQRLALARGLMASKPHTILLLDEPTSSVDTKNESEIYDNIMKTFKDKTIISSIHRLHLLEKFDTIYYFDKGEIIARGTLEELLKKSPAFKKLWTKYQRQKNL